MSTVLKKQSELVQRVVTAIILIPCCLALFFFGPPFLFSLMAVCTILYCAFFELPKLISYNHFFFWLVLFFYLLLPVFFLIQLNQSNERIFVFFLLCAVWGFDSGAYFVGKKWGKTKLAPTISPKKSLEGLFGGFLSVFLVLYLLGTWFQINLPVHEVIIISFLVSISAMSGDLFESWLKRQAGVKDVGSMLPGHGGILDRIDSVLGALPVWYLIIIKYFYLKK